MQTIKTALFAGAVALIVSVGASGVWSRSTTSQDLLASVVNSSGGTIHAGYIVYPPYIIKDPKTGELSGIFYDLTNALGDQLGLKISWVEAGGYGTIFADLNSGRYDVFGGGLWANSTRAKAGLFTDPTFYSPIYAYARSNDHRFDNNLSAINSSNITISTMDGAIDNVIANADYPKAKNVTLPQSALSEQTLLDVVSDKSDIVFAQPDVVALFLKTNPATLRKVSPKPLRTFGNSYAVRFGGDNLQQMLSIAIGEAVTSGTIDKILKKYQTSSDVYLRLAPAYAQ